MKTSTPDEVWRSLVGTAEAVCKRIETRPPDVILVLYKSGSIVWQATENWWRLTRGQPLPPVVGVNLGPSKFAGYSSAGYDWNGLEYTSWAQVGHLIAWVIGHDKWLELLQRRIAAHLDSHAPACILIVDDVISEGRTTVLVKSLLWALYPEASTPMIAGLPPDWREVLGRAWLQQQNLPVMPPGPQGWEESPTLRQIGISVSESFPWRQLITGLADTDYDPLGWCPLSLEHPLLVYLGQYLPVPMWMQFPRWVASMTEGMLQRQRQSGIDPMSRPFEVCGTPWRPQHGEVMRQYRLYALVWQKPWVSLQEAAERCNIPLDGIVALLEQGITGDELIRVEVDGVAGYALAPDVEPELI